MPVISVIVPIYNVAQYLDQAIRSVVDQTFTDWEMLLVDDGSSDGSERICDDWAGRDARIHAIHQPNGGVSAARNAGLDASHGEFVYLLDPDDYIHPQTLEILLGLAREHDADVALSFHRGTHVRDYAEPDCPTYVVRAVSGKQALEYLYLDNGQSMQFFGYNPTAVCGRMYARSLFDSLRFDTQARLAEDLIITPYLMDAARTVVSTDRRLYYVYHRPGSLTRSMPTAERAEGLTRAVCKMYLDRLAYFRNKKADGYAALLRGTYTVALFDLLEKRLRYRAMPVCRRLLHKTLRTIRRQMWKDRAADAAHMLWYSLLIAFPPVYRCICAVKK